MSQAARGAAPTCVVLASGRGSNFDALLKAGMKSQISALLTDKPEAGAVGIARAAGIPVLVVEPEPKEAGSLEERRRRHDDRVLKTLKEAGMPRFLIMAGYMRVVTSLLIEAFRSPQGYSRIVNVHPALLPSFKGIRAYEQAFNAGVKITGVSVHLVEEGVDEGPLCAQEAFDISRCSSVEEVERLGLAVEHRLYPSALRWITAEKFQFTRAQGGLAARVRPH